MDEKIESVRNALVESGYFDPELFEDRGDLRAAAAPKSYGIEAALAAARDAQQELHGISHFLHDRVIMKILEMERTVRDPQIFDELGDLLKRILSASDDFKREEGFVKIYGELLSVYTLILHRQGSPGRTSPIVRMILENTARRKAMELNQAELDRALGKLDWAVTIAVIAKRYAVFVLATRGLEVLFRREIEFQTFGKSPRNLAVQIADTLLERGIRPADVTDIVCAGGDLGTLTDGIYILNEKIRDGSRRRLGGSSLNRGALVAWELKEVLKNQGDPARIYLSLVSPLSFSTLNVDDMSSFLKGESRELTQSLKGLVKVSPLKSIAALISEIQKISPEDLNLLVMTLDALFASVVRKTGPRIIREMAAQEANRALSKFDFDKIKESLEKEGFAIPPHFGLASEEVGTGVKEICELLRIIESDRISANLARDLMHVVDTYARGVAMILEMASAGTPRERPHFVVITSMMALDPYFLQLFGKIRRRTESPFTPVLCLDSLEHEYLIARHLFERYINPAQGDRCLLFTVERKSMRHALKVLRSSGGERPTFSFSTLLDEVADAIAVGRTSRGNIVLVGADNEDALGAVANARDYGLLERVVLIGDPSDISAAAERTKIPIYPDRDPNVEILPIDTRATDFESKKKSMAEVFGRFIQDNPEFVIIKGSVPTAALLRKALSIYGPGSSPHGERLESRPRLASHTALFVLPDGRFFALSDAAVNPGFSNASALLSVVENQIEIVRKVVDPKRLLKVAIVTAVEKQTSAIPATLLAAEAVERAGDLEDRLGPFIVEGPLSFDLATVPEASEEKHYEGRIRGDADCLVATNISTANVLYKMLSKTMGSLGLIVDTGGIVTAGPGSAPIVLTSRGDTAQTKFNSILLAAAYADAGRN